MRRTHTDESPWWFALVVAAFAVPGVLLFEDVFGGGQGLMAAGLGAGLGILVGTLAGRLRWHLLASLAILLALHVLVGGAFAVGAHSPTEAIPSLQTLTAVARQSVDVWFDLLTLVPPAHTYLGPALLPWMVGLLTGWLASWLTMGGARPIAGTVPLIVFSAVAVAWGLSDQRPQPWWSAAWFAALIGWWIVSSQVLRLRRQQDLVVAKRGNADAVATDDHLGLWPAQRVLAALLCIAVAAGVAIPASAWLAGHSKRTVLRDLVEPPVRQEDYPSPLASFRHYTTDLANTELMKVEGLPPSARLRWAALDTYNGISFSMSGPEHVPGSGYSRITSDKAPGNKAVPVKISNLQRIGPWLPSVGNPQTVEPGNGATPAFLQGLRVNTWGRTLMSTELVGKPVDYQLLTEEVPVPADGQLQGVEVPEMTSVPNTGVPDEVGDLAREVAAAEQTAIAKARAIERHLAKKGFYSNARTAQSRSGHRADRLTRMLKSSVLIGDDEQYATLMALMLQSLNIPARVVMGAYAKDSKGGNVTLRGYDVHVWVEVPFEGVGWAHFDPAPPRDQVPKSKNPKPRTVPRPQVLQPPEPPERPVELPRSLSERDRPVDNKDDELAPWLAWTLAGTGGLLLLASPFLLIAGWKLVRRGRRRSAAAPESVRGAWQETIDFVTDSGLRVPGELTRREAAHMMLQRWWPDQVPATIAWWTPAEDCHVGQLAQQADRATFADHAPEEPNAGAAWMAWSQLRRDINQQSSWWDRCRRTFSLRSLRRHRHRPTLGTRRKP